MRHRNKEKILKRKRNARRALKRSLLRSFILAGKIQTTEAKAKVLKSIAERLVAKSRTGTMHERRRAGRMLDQKALAHLFNVVGPRYKERKGGYTRVMKRMPRKGDNAKMAIIEFV